MPEDTSFLKKYKPFKDFDDTDIQAMNELSILKPYKKDEQVFAEETRGDSMYIVKSGSVKILKVVKNQENTIAVLKAGEFFGEMALLDGQPRSATVKAIEPSDCLVITDKAYLKMRGDRPKTALKLMDIIIRVLSNRLRQANKNLEVISFWIE